MLEAVLFDWTNTLVEFTWDDELLAAGHRAPLGHDDPAFTGRYRKLVLGDTEHRPYAELLTELGVEDPDRCIELEHAAWRPAHQVLSSAQAMLVSLRRRGLKTGIVANSWPEPARLLRADVERYGLAGELDVQVWSEEVGARKPEPEIFIHALDRLGVDPVDALFVGDGLENDVQGAGDVGMTTAQALWFRADDTPGIEPDYLAFTPMDVLNPARACSAPVRSSTPTRRGATRTSAACRRCSTSRSTSTCCVRPRRASRASAPSVPCGGRCRCAAPRSSAPTRAASTKSSAA